MKWIAAAWMTSNEFFRHRSPKEALEGPLKFGWGSPEVLGERAPCGRTTIWPVRPWGNKKVVGKLWNPKRRLWRHLATVAQTVGPTAWRESAVWAAAARWRQSQRLRFHRFSTPHFTNQPPLHVFLLGAETRWVYRCKTFGKVQPVHRKPKSNGHYICFLNKRKSHKMMEWCQCHWQQSQTKSERV